MALTEPKAPPSGERGGKGEPDEFEDTSSHSNPVTEDQTSGEATASSETAVNDFSQEFLGGLMRRRMVASVDGKDDQFLPRTELQNLLPEQTMIMALSKLSISIPPEDLKRRQKLLAVLILAQKLATIKDFVREGIDDTHLPFYHRKGSNDTMRTLKRKDSKGQLIAIHSFSKWDDVAIDSFHQQQWKIQVPVFNKETPLHREFPVKTILPFIKRERKGAGGQGTVFRVEIHPGHHDGSKEPVQMYAVKTLKNASKEKFDEEVSNLRRFSAQGKEHPHLIRLLWTYQHGTDYHLVFPCATGNLMELWKEKMEPLAKRQDPAAALWFIRQLLGIAESLHAIHWYDNTNSSQSEKQRHGRHGDLKPENILWFKDLRNQEEGYSLGVLQISDFGLAKFHRTCSVREDVKNGVGASLTYRAPEYSIVGEVAQNYDVWSLACVFLEFITWYLNGSEQVAQFTQSREVEEDGNQRIIRLDFDPLGNYYEDKFFNYVTIPRDGRRLIGAEGKRSVANEITNLYKHPYGSDLTDDLLHFVETEMLRMRSHKRASCTKIRDKMRELYENCRTNHLYSQKRLRPISERNNTKLSLLEPVIFDLPPLRDAVSNIRDFDSSSGFSSRPSSVISQTSQKRFSAPLTIAEGVPLSRFDERDFAHMGLGNSSPATHALGYYTISSVMNVSTENPGAGAFKASSQVPSALLETHDSENSQQQKSQPTMELAPPSTDLSSRAKTGPVSGALHGSTESRSLNVPTNDGHCNDEDSISQASQLVKKPRSWVGSGPLRRRDRLRACVSKCTAALKGLLTSSSFGMQSN